VSFGGRIGMNGIPGMPGISSGPRAIYLRRIFRILDM